MTNSLNIIVSGRIASQPGHGGATWAVLQYLLGLRRLGHAVYFVEPLEASSLIPEHVALARTENARYFERTIHEFGFLGYASLLLSGTSESVGLPYAQVRALARRADILINLSGTLADADLMAGIPLRVYVDLDPGFTQVWDTQAIDVGLDGHTHFTTVGLCMGQLDCKVPTCSRQWLTHLPPVVLEYWPVSSRIVHDAFTSIANWRGYGSIEHRGIFYGQKAHSLREIVQLPLLTSEQVLLALRIHPDERKDLAALRTNKWHLSNPEAVAGTPAAYQQFVQGSKAEIGIAKSGYVAARTGWFSDRSICYLASGRPVVAQDTGFSRFLPTGKGLLTFDSTNDALSGFETISSDYAEHARAARAIAEAHFDSDIVLDRLLRRVGAQ